MENDSKAYDEPLPVSRDAGASSNAGSDEKFERLYRDLERLPGCRGGDSAFPRTT